MLGLLGKMFIQYYKPNISRRASLKILMWPFTMVWSTDSMKFSAAKVEFPVVYRDKRRTREKYN